MKEYVTIRIANRPDGTATVPMATHETREAADKEFFRLCTAAVDSDYITDSVALLTWQGFELRHETFDHRDRPQPEPEPEPTEE